MYFLNIHRHEANPLLFLTQPQYIFHNHPHHASHLEHFLFYQFHIFLQHQYDMLDEPTLIGKYYVHILKDNNSLIKSCINYHIKIFQFQKDNCLFHHNESYKFQTHKNQKNLMQKCFALLNHHLQLHKLYPYKHTDCLKYKL